jgi:hypothetical protein
VMARGQELSEAGVDYQNASDSADFRGACGAACSLTAK